MKTNILWACLAVVLVACNSDDSDDPQAAKEFPHGTEWVGVLDRSGYQYAPPACLRFKDDERVVVYAPHFFVVDGSVIRPDSVQGSVTSIVEVDGTTLEVRADMEHYGQVTMTIKDRKTLTSTSSNASKPTPFTFEIYDTPQESLAGSTWSGPIMTGGPTAGMYAYPDLSSIRFLQNTTTYLRNGLLVTMSPNTSLDGPLENSYRQDGAMVFMFGFNESEARSYDYFGVLLPGNDRMMVHSAVTGARLPYYTQTIPWNGPIGQTPIIERQ